MTITPEMLERYRRIVIRPVVTEKSMAQAEGTLPQNKYTFEVHRSATKIDIRSAIETMFDVSVANVRTMNYAGKDRRVGRSVGRRPDWKKAIVKLAEGESIDMFEGA